MYLVVHLDQSSLIPIPHPRIKYLKTTHLIETHIAHLWEYHPFPPGIIANKLTVGDM